MVTNNTYLVVERNGDAKAEIFEGKDGLFYLVDVLDTRPVLGPYKTIDRAAEVAAGLDVEDWLDAHTASERSEADHAYAQVKGWVS